MRAEISSSVSNSAGSTTTPSRSLVMFDCHAHLTDISLRGRIDEILAEAEAAGVTGIITVSESLEDAEEVRTLLCETYHHENVGSLENEAYGRYGMFPCLRHPCDPNCHASIDYPCRGSVPSAERMTQTK